MLGIKCEILSRHVSDFIMDGRVGQRPVDRLELGKSEYENKQVGGLDRVIESSDVSLS